MPIDWIHIEILFALTILAEVLGVLAGFGSSIFFVPLAAWFFDVESVLGLTACFHLGSNAIKLVFFRKGVNWKWIKPMMISAVILVALGAWLAGLSDAVGIEWAIAVVAVGWSAYQWFYPNHKWPSSARSLWLGGSVSGFLAGFTGTGGMIRGLVLSSFSLSAETFIATNAMIDLFVDATRTLVYASNGFIHVHDLKLLPVLFLASIIGTWLGKMVLKKIAEDRFRKIVLVVIFISGSAKLIQWILGK
jgi:uncharacterized membrane protein YfcA